MTRGCYEAGDAGMCGLDCEEFQEGRCEVVEEFVEQNLKDLDLDSIFMIKEAYPDKAQWVEHKFRELFTRNKHKSSSGDYASICEKAMKEEKHEFKLYNFIVELQQIEVLGDTSQYYLSYHTVFNGSIFSSRHYHLAEYVVGNYNDYKVEEILEAIYGVERREYLDGLRVI